VGDWALVEPRGDANGLLPEGEEIPPAGVRNMAIARWALVGLMAVVAAAAWVHYFDAGPGTSHAVVQYHCPMHPSVITDLSGACPICGMDLVPIRRDSATIGRPIDVSNGEKAHLGVPGLVSIDLAPERIQLFGMRTAPVTREKLSPTIRTVGVVTATEGGISLVTAHFSGWIEELLVAESGHYVKKGQTLARIYSPELLSAQQAYLSTLRWLDDKQGGSQGTERSLAAERDARARLQLAGISNADIDKINRTREAVRALSVPATVSGYVGNKTAVNGLYVQPGTELFELTDLSRVWVMADVYESEIERVRRGQRATVVVPAIPGEIFVGQLSFVYPALSTSSRTLKVRLDFKNPGLKLRPGMFADVTLDLGAVDGLVIPSEAVVDTGEVQYVFVAHEGGHFEPRRVKIGSRGVDKVQLLEGAGEGETVVTTANFLVDSESRLRAGIESPSGGELTATPRPGPGEWPSR